MAKKHRKQNEKERANTLEGRGAKHRSTPSPAGRKQTTLEKPPPPISGAQKTKPEHPRRILQMNVKESERQPSISGTKDGEKTRE